MLNALSKRKCDVYATALLKELKIDSLPIDPRAIAQRIGLNVIEEGFDGCDGCFMREVKAIIINKNMDEGRKRFTIAHELGHARIPFHNDKEYKDSRENIGFPFTKKQEEDEANEFASELLMPTFLIGGIVKSEKMGLNAIRLIAEKCQTSFTSSALAYVKASPELCVMVLSEASKIKYSFASNSLRKKKVFLSPKTPLHKSSFAGSFFNEQAVLKQSAEDRGKIQNVAWVPDLNYSDYTCFEHSQTLDSYNQTISLVWWVPNHDDFEEEDDDIYIGND